MRSTSYVLSNLWDGIQNGEAWDAGVVFKRTNALPIDKYSVVSSYSAALDYATNSLVAYPGQTITVVDNATSVVSTYKIRVDGTLKQIDDVDYDTTSSLVSAVSSVLSNAISSKIYFNDYGTEKFGDLSVIKLGAEEYARLLDLSATNKQAIYIVSSDNKNAYGKKIINLADGSSLSDAVNLKQLTSTASTVSSDLTTTISSVSSELTSDISSISSALSNDLSTKIFFKEYDEEGKYGDLSVIKIGAEKYAELLDLSATNKQAIYIISSLNEDVYGQKIINLADGSSLSDAVNFKQLTSAASTVSSELTSNISSVSSILSDAISVKVQIHDYDNSVRYTDLSIIKMQKDAYDTARSGGLNQDALYMVSSDYIDAYGGQVKNVDDATQDYDAVNLKQLKKKIFIRNYDKSGNELTAFDDLSVLKMSIDEYKDLVQSDEISALSNSLFVISSNNIDALMQRVTNLGDGVDDYDAVNMKQFVRVSSDIASATNTKIFFKEYDNPGEYNDLSIVKIGMDEYENLLDPDSDVDVDEHTIYFISSDNKNAYGEKIVNLADGTDPTDAINKSQLTNCLSGYPNLSSVNWNSISLSTLVDMVKFAFSQLGGGQVSY